MKVNWKAIGIKFEVNCKLTGKKETEVERSWKELKRIWKETEIQLA